MEPLEQSLVPVFLDSDNVDQDLQAGAIRYALNCQIGSTDKSNLGAISTKNGNVLIQFDMPAGVNICIGQYEDEVTKTIFFFVFNSVGNHQILRYFLNETNGFVNSIFLWSGLNFQAGDIANRDSLVTGVSFVENKLYWTDFFNGSRKLNTAKADLNGKIIVANVYFGTTKDGSFLAGNDFHFIVNTISINLFTTSNTTPTLSDLCIFYATIFNASGFLHASFTAVAFSTYVQITAKDSTQWDLQAISTQGVCQLIYQNIYALPYVTDYIDLGKYPPSQPLTFTYLEDTTYKQNLVQQFVGQFRYRYVYDDFEKSVWSPYSKLAAPNDPNFNYIELDFGNDRINGPISSIILRVELSFRIDNDPVDNFIISLDQSEYVSGKFNFYNDGSYTGIYQAETTKPNDAIPIRNKALALIKDRIILGGNVEGYNPVNFDANLTLGFSTAPKQVKWQIVGNLRIRNEQIRKYPQLLLPTQNTDHYQPIHRFDTNVGPVFGGMGSYQPSGLLTSDLWEPGLGTNWDQRIPEGGFPIYLAGTPYFTISQQINDSYHTKYYVNNGSDQVTVSVATTTPSLVFDSSSFGNANLIPEVYNVKFETHRQAIRRLNATIGCLSNFFLNDIPPGEYIIRAASHWCSHGDKISKGAIYDLNDPTLRWQQTSTNIYAIAGHTGFETKINLGEDGQTFSIIITDGSGHDFTYTGTQSNGVLDLRLLPNGETVIDDLTYPVQPAANTSLAAVGYLVDAIDPQTETGGSIDSTLIANSIRIENQILNITTGVPAVPVGEVQVKTDHNGYFYYAEANLFGLFGGTKLVDFSNGSGLGQWIKISDNIFRGGLNQMLTKSLTPGNYKPGFDFTGNLTEYIAVNLNATASAALSTFVNGTVTDFNNIPLRDVLVIIGRNGRQERTQADGSYSIRVYVDAAGISSIHTVIVFNFTYFKGVYINGVISDNLVISYPPYSITNPYIFTKEQYLVDFLFGDSFLKRGGIYQYAGIHFDPLLRPFPLSISDNLKVRIPFWTEDLNQFDPAKYPTPATFNYNTPEVSWQIISKPPIGATKFAWLRSKRLNLNTGYFEWVADSIQYISGFDTSNTPINTTYGAGNATFIMISLGNLVQFNQSLFNVLLTGTTNQIYPFGYQFQEGDRLRLIKDNHSNYYTTYFDAPIKEMIGLSIVVEALNIYPQLHAGTYFEIYNDSNNQVTLFYYEIGDFINIVNGAYAQTSGIFNSGDTHIYNRSIVVNSSSDAGQGLYTVKVESESVSDFFPSLASDIGRSWIQNKDAKQTLYSAGLRWSNKFITGTFVNGLSTFDALNEDSLSVEDGLIQKLVTSFIGSAKILLAIQTVQTTSIYIEEALLRDNAGQQYLAISDGVIGGKSLLEGNIGTSYPESIVEYKGRVWGYSDNQSGAFRYSRDGMKLISDYNRINDFRILTKGLLSQDNPTYVFGGYDPVNDEFVLTPIYTEYIQPIVVNDPSQLRLPQETVTFNNNEAKWTSNYNFLAEMYSRVGSTVFVSFKDGQLWLHDKNPICNNFYGVQYNSQIRFVANMYPKSVKTWVAGGFKSTDSWNWDEIKTVTDFYSPTGQLSSILADEFDNLEGVFYSEIFRDVNTPYVQFPLVNGDNMRGEILYINISNSLTTKVIFYHLFIRALYSLPTQKT